MSVNFSPTKQYHYFDDFFVSETIGYDKPSKEFFDKAIKEKLHYDNIFIFIDVSLYYIRFNYGI